MRITKLLVLVLLVSLAIPSVFSQDLGNLETDLKTVFTGIGREITPRLHQMALSGNDLMGEAKLRGLTGFYFSVAGLNLSTLDGIGSVLTADNTEWKFDLISIPDIIRDALGEGGDTETYFNTATKQAMALPSLRIGFGFPLPLGLELLANGIYLPPSLVEVGFGLAGEGVPEALKSGTTLDMFTLGGIIRKPILSDKRGLLRPSLSLGASYTYSSFTFGLPKFDINDLVDGGIDLGDLGTLNMAGNVQFATKSQSIGGIVHLSKTFFWILTPFVKAGAYYHFSEYESVFVVKASGSDAEGNVTLTEKTLDASTGIIKTNDVSMILSGGLEIKLPPVVLTTTVSLDLERPVVGMPPISDLTSGNFSGLTLNGLSIMLALRLQI